jgi:hypothetical protein
MGHTLDQWVARIQQAVREEDSGGQIEPTALLEIAIRPALMRYSIDRPLVDVAEVAGAASSYFALPTGWVDGYSELRSVEHPARQNPPIILDSRSWTITRDPSTVTTKKILLYYATPAASEYVRFEYTRPWPMPDTADATVDMVDDIAFEAVAMLAASHALMTLANETARSRMADVLSPDYVDHQQRFTELTGAADRLRQIYEAFLGLSATAAGGVGVRASPPASRSIDFEQYKYTMFHGGR